MCMSTEVFELWLKEHQEVSGVAIPGKPDGLFIDLFYNDTRAMRCPTIEEARELLSDSPYRTCQVKQCYAKGKPMEGVFHIR